MSAAVTSSPEGFPPQDLRRFLELCAGEWLALRSHFDLNLVVAQAEPSGAPAAEAAVRAEAGAAAGSAAAGVAEGTTAAASGSEADGVAPDWEALLAQARAEQPEAPLEEAWHSSERGELRVAYLAPEQADQPGGLRITPPRGDSRELTFRPDGRFEAAGDGSAGRWQLWPDGSLELLLEVGGGSLRERIWFTQPNLRLRSSVEQGAGGRPGRARFSSEIRRVSKPAA